MLCRDRGASISMKYYGHNDRLEEKVAEIVERFKIEEDIVLMSLDSKIASSMKTLRPDWQVGLLTAKAVGDLTKSPADFLAVHIGIATTPFVRRAHAAGKKVYVWTVNDKLNMSRMMSRGVDGIITDFPSLAKSVIEERAELSSAERLMLGAAYLSDSNPRSPLLKGTLTDPNPHYSPGIYCGRRMDAICRAFRNSCSSSPRWFLRNLSAFGMAALRAVREVLCPRWFLRNLHAFGMTALRAVREVLCPRWFLRNLHAFGMAALRAVREVLCPRWFLRNLMPSA